MDDIHQSIQSCSDNFEIIFSGIISFSKQYPVCGVTENFYTLTFCTDLMFCSYFANPLYF